MRNLSDEIKLLIESRYDEVLYCLDRQSNYDTYKFTELDYAVGALSMITEVLYHRTESSVEVIYTQDIENFIFSITIKQL